MEWLCQRQHLAISMRLALPFHLLLFIYRLQNHSIHGTA